MTVTVDGSYNIGSLVFDNTNGTNYSLGTDSVAGHGLTLNGGGAGATITVAASGVANPTTTIYANLTLADNATFDVAAGNSLVLSVSGAGPAATIGDTGSHSLTKTGPGILTIDRTSTYGGGTIVSDGTLNVTATGSIGSAGPLEVDGLGGNNSVVNLLNTGASQSVAGLSGSVSGGGTARVSVAANATLTVNQASGTSTFGGTVALAAGSPGAALAKSGGGTQVLTAAPQLGAGSQLAVSEGTLRIAATSGTVSVGTGVTADVSGTGTLELAGTLSALGTTTVGNRVAITNNSSAAAGVLVSGGTQQVGAIDGTGNVQVAPPSGQSVSLTADRITAGALIIGGDASSSALVSIAPSDTSGDPLSASGGFALAGSLSSSGSLAGGASSASSLLAGDGSAATAALDSAGLGGGSTPVASAVPEPSSLLLMVFGGLALLLLATRRTARARRITG